MKTVNEWCKIYQGQFYKPDAFAAIQLDAAKAGMRLAENMLKELGHGLDCADTECPACVARANDIAQIKYSITTLTLEELEKI